MGSENGAKRMVKRVESIVVRSRPVAAEREPMLPVPRPVRPPVRAAADSGGGGDLLAETPVLPDAGAVRRRMAPSRRTLARYRQSSQPPVGILIDTVA